MLRKYLILIGIGLFSTMSTYGTHIVGGEIYYECIDPSSYVYRVTLELYRDCSGGNAGYDPVVYMGLYDGKTDTLLEPPGTINIPFPGSDTLTSETYQTCFFAPPDLCVERATYTTQVSLPPRDGGYNIMYQRCCRNETIKNLQSPLSTGASWVAHIPDSSLKNCNSSASFDIYPPIVLCSNASVDFDHSATDPDGDSLAYRLCTPTTSTQIVTGPSNVEDSLPNFNTVSYLPGYNAQDPLDVPGGMNIDPVTGHLTGATPNSSNDSQYVVGVCVDEYDTATGQLINTNKRDFQFAMAFCDTTLDARIGYTVDTCLNKVNFTNMTNKEADGLLWDFNIDSLLNDTSSQENTYYIYPEADTYDVRLIANPNTSCADTLDTTLTFSTPSIRANFGYNGGCLGDTTYFTDSSSGYQITERKWSFGDGTTVQNVVNPMHVYNNTGTYNPQLIIRTEGGCTDTSSTNQNSISIHPDPTVDAGRDTAIERGQRVVLGNPAQQGTSPFNYNWVPAQWLNNNAIAKPTANPDKDVQYVVTVTDSNNCQDKDSVFIEVLFPAEIQVPDAFTPDNDGTNDKFYAYDVSPWDGRGIVSMEFRIFDRWGELVFETSSVHEGWDGRHMKTDQRMEVGVYVWTLRYKTETGKEIGPKTGTVSLIR